MGSTLAYDPWLEVAARLLGCFLFFLSAGVLADYAPDLKHAHAYASLMRIDICGKTIAYVGRLGNDERLRRPDQIMSNPADWDFFAEVQESLPIDPEIDGKRMTVWTLDVADADIACPNYPRPRPR